MLAPNGAGLVPNTHRPSQEIKDFFESGSYDFFLQLEEDFECASVCQPALFYLSLDISEGAPKADCIGIVQDDWMALAADVGGFSAFIAALILGSILLVFPLCSGFHPCLIYIEQYLL